jgi:hypothetical protein
VNVAQGILGEDAVLGLAEDEADGGGRIVESMDWGASCAPIETGEL